jgi:uncharacterized protein YyaL (SSP411 family)
MSSEVASIESRHVPDDGMPGVLRHLQRLTDSFVHQGECIPYIHVYARPLGPGREPPLAFITAEQSGPEGLGCVDDAARAALLALSVHEKTGCTAALHLARAWLDFVTYMQEPNGGFVNFILDAAGTKNRDGLTSYPGGPWWTARARWALARAWRCTGDEEYHRRATRGGFAWTDNLKVLAVQVLALLELYEPQRDAQLARRILRRCDAIVASGPNYVRDRTGQRIVALWGYHQLQALAQAGHLLGRPDYLAACAMTVTHLVVPVIAGGFYHVYPRQREPQCAYDISALALGLADLYRATGGRQYRALALRCIAWLDGANVAGRAVYDRDTGRCADGVKVNRVSTHCGAESAIEAGFMEMARRDLHGTI